MGIPASAGSPSESIISPSDWFSGPGGGYRHNLKPHPQWAQKPQSA